MDGYSPIHPFMKKPYTEADSWLFEDKDSMNDLFESLMGRPREDAEEDEAVNESLEVDVVVVGNGYIVKTASGDEFVAENKETLRVILKEALAAKGLTRKVERGLG